MIKSVCVCGAGTMGHGIAQVFAQHGFDTLLFDLSEPVLKKARESMQYNLQHLVERGKIAPREKDDICGRIHYTADITECHADIIVEAIVEQKDAKAALFSQLAGLNGPQVIFATNTSSLRVSEIQNQVIHPERIIGMHFFNPAPIMRLVEIIEGRSTDKAVTDIVYNLCTRIAKTPVICKDAPGFIVNRIARHYYLEAMMLIEEGIATFEDVDNIMKATGFKMGPFKLMDLIGIDINLSVTESLYAAFDKAPRFKPSNVQAAKVAAGELGRKTGRGFYTYPQSGATAG